MDLCQSPRRRLRPGFSRKEKNMIYNVFKYFCKTMNVSAAVKEASKALCCTERSVYNVKKEMENDQCLSPKKPDSNNNLIRENSRMKTYDASTQSVVRHKVHDYLFQNVPPTLNLILSAINNDENVPNLSRPTLHRLLHDIGFEYKKVGRKTILLEREDIIRWRHIYLININRYRDQGRYIIYTDESWVNTGHCVSKSWQDTTINNRRQAFIEGVSTGLNVPSGSGARFALLHAGGNDGFVENAELTFLCKKNTADVHHEMDAETYEKWFVEQLLPNIPQNSVIVLDNASYHSRKVEKIPTTSWRKQHIINWMIDNNVPYDDNMLKKDLLQCVAQVKSDFDKKVLDVIAEERGHTVLRLPPYHCELNPIEMVWAQVKHYIKMNNNTFKVKDMSQLIKFGYSNVTVQNWQNYITHVKEIENRMRRADNIQDDVEEFIIHVTASSSDEEYDDINITD